MSDSKSVLIIEHKDLNALLSSYFFEEFYVAEDFSSGGEREMPGDSGSVSCWFGHANLLLDHLLVLVD